MPSSELVPIGEVVEGELLDDECEGGYDGCGGYGELQPDPYVADLFGECVLMNLCDNCAAERAADV